MARCSHCGKMNKGHAKSCVSCGSQLAKPGRYFFVCLIGIVLVVIGCISISLVVWETYGGIAALVGLGLLVVGPICIGYAYWRAPARDRRLIYYSLADPLGIVGNFIIGPNQRPRATKHNPAVAAKKANMVCKGCGRRLEAGWKLCPWCGLEIR
jgi:RNA polymerase subunit RPABC4/transcription elongation factor Spt4